MTSMAWKLLWMTAMAGAVFWILERKLDLKAVNFVWIGLMLMVGAALFLTDH